MHTWICDVYNQTPHRTTLRTPASHWRELVSSVDLRLPESAAALDVMVASVERRPIHHYGINLNNLKYHSKELVDLCRRVGKTTVTIRWKRTDLGEIYVFDDTTNRYLTVPCTAHSYASGLSLWLHQVIRKEALSMFDDQSQACLDAAKARIRDICKRSMSSKRLTTRKSAARADAVLRNNENSIAPTAAKEMPVTILPLPSDSLTGKQDWQDCDDEVPDFDASEQQ